VILPDTRAFGNASPDVLPLTNPPISRIFSRIKKNAKKVNFPVDLEGRLR
jgi:hypothetical protein